MSERETVKILVRRRLGDGLFAASIDARPRLWSVGASPDAAIGALVRTSPETFGIAVEDDWQAEGDDA